MQNEFDPSPTTLDACVGAAHAVSCTTQSQTTSTRRDALTAAARTIVAQIKTGDIEALRATTIPAVSADFDEIASSVKVLKPTILPASITIDELYWLDASANPALPSKSDFYCG